MHTDFIVPSQIAYKLRLISNLLHGLGEHANVPSCSEEGFPDHRAAQIKCKHFYGCMGVISLHIKQLLIQFKPACSMDCVNIQMYHHEGKGGWLGFSLSRWQGYSNYDMEILAFL